MIKKRTERKQSEPKPVERKMYGLLAKFETQEALVKATRQLYQSGYRQFDAYSPYPVEELSHEMHLKPSPLPLVIFWILVAVRQ